MSKFPLVRAFGLLAFVFALPRPAAAGYEWGFADMNLNHLIWDASTKEKSTKTDFNYLEFEGGGQFSWGEVYGFFDVENVGKRGEVLRTAAKGSVRKYLGRTGAGFSLYGHVYNFTAPGFSEQNRVYGLGYQVSGPTWWVKPFLGFHDVTQTFFNGSNGFMGGWVVGYGFQIGKEQFLLADWHEIEFARKDEYAAQNGYARSSQNGAASAWWIATRYWSIGAQWRYALNKLGTEGWQNAAIFTAKYTF